MSVSGSDGGKDSILSQRLGGKGPVLPNGFISKEWSLDP